VQNKSAHIICNSSRCSRAVSFTLRQRYRRHKPIYSTTVDVCRLHVLASKAYQFPFFHFFFQLQTESTFLTIFRLQYGMNNWRIAVCFPAKASKASGLALGPIHTPFRQTP